jgi:MarR family transcriptional regulator, organic hydroperoxide resistance regulator
MATQTEAKPTPAHEAPTPAHEAQRLFFELGMTQRKRIIARLAKLGLTFPQAHALRLLEPHAPVPMRSLAELLVCDASNVTGIADRLEGRGLVERRSAEHDRRIRVLALTPSGTEMRERVLEAMMQPPPAMLALPEADQRALRDILRRALELQEAAERESAAPGPE